MGVQVVKHGERLSSAALNEARTALSCAREAIVFANFGHVLKRPLERFVRQRWLMASLRVATLLELSLPA